MVQTPIREVRMNSNSDALGSAAAVEHRIRHSIMSTIGWTLPPSSMQRERAPSGRVSTILRLTRPSSSGIPHPTLPLLDC